MVYHEEEKREVNRAFSNLHFSFCNKCLASCSFFALFIISLCALRPRDLRFTGFISGGIMTAFALTLVLSAAFIHASWNLLAKKAGGGAAFIWLFATLSTLFYAPLAVIIYFWQKPDIGLIQVCFMAGSALIHVGYFLLLQRGYRIGDFSLVYPLARGTGPTLSTIAAILFFRESPSSVAFAGALLVAGGVFLLTSGKGALGGS